MDKASKNSPCYRLLCHKLKHQLQHILLKIDERETAKYIFLGPRETDKETLDNSSQTPKLSVNPVRTNPYANR